MQIVAKRLPLLPPLACEFFWRGHGWFFDSWPYLLTSIICQFYHLIIPTPATVIGARTLPCTCGATIIDRPRLLSIARDYYRSPATIIDRPQLLSIARDYYRSPATIIDRPRLKRANNLLIMIIAAGGRVRRRRTLPPLLLV